MEQNTDAATVKIQSNIFQKFIGICISVITLGVTLMVSFIWDLRSDFSTEKQKVENTQAQVVEVKSTLADDGKRINDLEKTTNTHDYRISNLEQKKR